MLTVWSFTNLSDMSFWNGIWGGGINLAKTYIVLWEFTTLTAGSLPFFGNVATLLPFMCPISSGIVAFDIRDWFLKTSDQLEGVSEVVGHGISSADISALALGVWTYLRWHAKSPCTRTVPFWYQGAQKVACQQEFHNLCPIKDFTEHLLLLTM